MNGQPVKGLCVQLQTHRPAHLVTLNRGSHELETTLRYFEELGQPGPNYEPHKSPFRPSRLGPFPIRSVTIDQEDVIISSDGGSIRLPLAMTVYSVE